VGGVRKKLIKWKRHGEDRGASQGRKNQKIGRQDLWGGFDLVGGKASQFRGKQLPQMERRVSSQQAE